MVICGMDWSVECLAEVKADCIKEFKQFIDHNRYALLTTEKVQSKITDIAVPYYSDAGKWNQFYSHLRSELQGMFNRYQHREVGY